LIVAHDGVLCIGSTQLPLPAAPRRRNQQLFSDYYLDALLPQRGDWQMVWLPNPALLV